ncbi:MAG: GNAT family N-acetyltransferase [Candidatus Eisenbacteria bacterium]
MKVVIKPLLSETDGILGPLLGAYDFKSYFYYHQVEKPKRDRYFAGEIEAKRRAPGSKFWIAVSGDDVVGLASLSFQEWDTEQLGVRAGKIGCLLPELEYSVSYDIKKKLVEAVLGECVESGMEFVAVRLNANEISSIHVLEDLGFRTVDGILTFAYDLRKGEPDGRVPDFDTRAVKDTDLDGVRRIATSSFRHGRFHADPRIAGETADGLYGAWLENSFRGVGADAVIVGVKEDRVLGFITCKIDERSDPELGLAVGIIVLVAVDEKARGGGVASALTAEALRWFGRHGVDVVEVGTQQRNIPACRVYERAGFRLVTSSISMHRWME